ncbi:tetratricopeptide repeat protein [Anaeromyxobacter paludicola]|uniref:Tetratricopeptide repeat protein n=1 Tax=Anaeromyxobacter paludicola TaxID=2918171 RepID=A0ABM7XEF6_9BACT|nr:tetratricopeptide repeat protein [Anaeromyxobacter paludicola]BDG10273.1 hypothetical protein AMPC_33860 [Anaeromyxobacter paludicola]
MTRAAALLLLAAGLSPLTRPDPGVEAGNARLEAGEPAEALRRYDDAERRLGPRAGLDLDRGLALYRLGRYGEARDAFAKALTSPKGERPGRARYDLAGALAAAGDDDGAIRELTRALAEDPGDVAARHNLEVLLRRKQEGGAGGSAKRPDERKGAGAPQPSGDAARAGPRAASAPSAGSSSQPPASPPSPSPGSASQPPTSPPSPSRQPSSQPPASPPSPHPGATPSPPGGEGGGGAATRSPRPDAQGAPRPGRAGPGASGERRDEAFRLLDALRSREKNLPMWPAREGQERSRGDAAQDW